MRLRHPYALEDDAPDPEDRVHWGGRREVAEVDEDGTFEVPDEHVDRFLREWPTAACYDCEDLAVDGGEDEADADEGNEENDDGDADELGPGDRICTCDVGEACDECGGMCPVIKSDDEVCGRDRPCRYHSED